MSDLTAETFLIAGSWQRGQHSSRLPRLRFVKILHILIVESEMSLAMDLEMMIEKIASATFVTEASVGAAKKVLHEDLDFAFLDVDVTKGKTFEIAEILARKHVPYAFISASRQDQLPLELRRAPFIPKPFYAAQIKSVLQAIAA
jgi:DNA-binding response OmpR family regulator